MNRLAMDRQWSTVRTMDIDDLLHRVVEVGASDLHIKVPSVPIVRIDGELAPLDDLPQVSPEWAAETLEQITDEEQKALFRKNLELDFAYTVSGLARFRANASLQRGSVTLVFRQISWQIPSIDDLGLPEICKSLSVLPIGLVLVTGPTGSGKSTTLAAMIGYLNKMENRRVITIEDPIEFLHSDANCIITQREVGSDTRSFANALRSALRQDPDVILVGEMRDLETISAALTATETGHLVFATLHTPGAAEAIDRIIDVFPPHQQQQVRVQLSTTLEAVLYQALLPKASGSGRVAAFEVLIATGAVRNLIREGKTHQMINVMQTGAQYGMQSLEQDLARLVRNKTVTLDAALSKSSKPEDLKRLLGRY